MAIQTDTVIAANRFGLGAKPGELSEIGSSPRDWLMQQLGENNPLFSSTDKIPTSEDAIKGILELRDNTMAATQEGKEPSANPKDVMKLGQTTRPMYMEHIAARSRQVIKTDQSFRERLVHFWSNHFAVSADNQRMLGLAGTLEFEVIRPTMSGHFSDMLLAVEKHPAMLMYLNNEQSVGPNSTLSTQAKRRNVRRKIDINENLAREIMELHTLGVNGGYTQEDVTNFAKVISGWSVGGLYPRLRGSGTDGKFYFNDLLHEPGAQKILKKNYNQPGIEQGEAVLKDIALHPSTARFLSTKLARHFIEDNPSEKAISTLEKTYMETEGYLPAVYESLINLEEAWLPEQRKFKTPKEFVYSIFRSINFEVNRGQQVSGPLTILGQQPFKPGSPAGWPDTAREWSGGEALMKRVELASTIGNNIGNRMDPKWLANEILGPGLDDHTRTEIARAESGSQGLALLFASPEFLRR